jgi:Phosphatidylinositol 3- and 4-kinase/FATC domain
MSMVGYVLGLGDRHPSNLMLDRKSGKVLHIDFGDCFEVAMQREKFPERVPFRLTRMLVKAMEVSGIEGNYRLTCEKVMTVLRDNNDSLVATLEAFVHDPLISWRLLNIDRRKDRKGPEGRASTMLKPAKPVTSTPRLGVSLGTGGSASSQARTPGQSSMEHTQTSAETGKGVQGEREREKVEIKRDLTDTFASCEDTAAPSSFFSSHEVKPLEVNQSAESTRTWPAIPTLSLTPNTEGVKHDTEVPFTTDSSISSTSVIRPFANPTVPPAASTSTSLGPGMPSPAQVPAYPACFVGGPRRGSLTRYTQLCNKMEPLIENVLERMDSMGNLLETEEGDLKKSRVTPKFKRPVIVEDEDSDVEETVLNRSASEILGSLEVKRETEPITHAVEGGIPFSSKKKYVNDIVLSSEHFQNSTSPVNGVFPVKSKVFDFESGFKEWSTTVVAVDKSLKSRSASDSSDGSSSGNGSVTASNTGNGNGTAHTPLEAKSRKKEKENENDTVVENIISGAIDVEEKLVALEPARISPGVVDLDAALEPVIAGEKERNDKKKPTIPLLALNRDVLDLQQDSSSSSNVISPRSSGNMSPKASPKVPLTITTTTITKAPEAAVTPALSAVDGPVSVSYRPPSMGSSFTMNSGSSFKQLQYQLRQQRHLQQYQPLDSEPVLPISAGLSSYRPNLHLEMSSLANSVSVHSPPHTSYSLAHRSVRELSLAQALAVGGEQITVPEEAEYDESDAQQELLTDKAVTVIRRVMDKLTGLDFYDPSSLLAPTALDVPEQVDRLIIQATANENLCLSFLGWCPFW